MVRIHAFDANSVFQLLIYLRTSKIVHFEVVKNFVNIQIMAFEQKIETP